MSGEAVKAMKPTEPVKPANLGDEESVRERNQSINRKHERVLEGLRYVMASPKGRAWMRWLLTEQLFTQVGTHLPKDAFTGNSTTFYNTAGKRMGEVLTTELKKFCRDDYRRMEDEGEG